MGFILDLQVDLQDDLQGCAFFVKYESDPGL